jgi:hypothetical protein
MREAERFEESERSREISDGQIDEDLSAHEEGYFRQMKLPVQSNDEQTIPSRTGRTRFCEKSFLLTRQLFRGLGL